MVAGDTKRVIVVRNISSNLIEEAILILKNEPGSRECREATEKAPKSGKARRNDLLLKEAENIINEYIREHGLNAGNGRFRRGRRNKRGLKILAGVVLNIFALALIALLALLGVRAL